MIDLNIKPEDELYNPTTQKVYRVKQQVPGEGILMVDPQSREETLLPDDAMKDPTRPPVIPVMKTTELHDEDFMGEEINKIVGHDELDTHDDDEIVNKVQEHLKEDMTNSVEQIGTDQQMIEEMVGNQLESIQEDTQLFNELGKSEGEEGKVVTEVEVPGGPKEEPISELVHEKEDELHELENPLASTHKPMPVVAKVKRWHQIRSSVKTQGQIEREKRQEMQLKKISKGLTFSPDSRDAGDSGHSKINNVPVTSPPKEKDKVIGLTEFPKDQDRDDSTGLPLDNTEGYRIPFKEMDEKHVAEREKYDNEQRQYLPHMTIREFRALLTGKDDRSKFPQTTKSIEQGKGLEAEREAIKPEPEAEKVYDIETEAILREVGITAQSAEGEPEVKEGPITYKPTKTAPKLEEYAEPEVIEPAVGKLKEAVTKFKQAQEELEALKSKLDADLKPLKEAVAKLQSEMNPQLAKQAKLVESYLEMVYNSLSETADHVAHYGDTILARVHHMKDVKPAVTIQQVIAEAETLDTELATAIAKLRDVVESKQKGTMLERFVYEFPISKAHEPRIKRTSLIINASVEALLEDLAEILHDFAKLNKEFSMVLSQEVA